MSGNGLETPEIATVWAFGDHLAFTDEEVPSVAPSSSNLSVRANGNVNVLVTSGSVESNFLTLTTKCVSEFDHADVPALHVLIEFLTATEGPLWRNIRGKGLSYSYGIRLNVELGLLSFHLFRSSQLVEAYQASIDIIVVK